MGSTAAQMLLKKLHGESTPDLIHVDPGLIVRESTARVCAKSSRNESDTPKIEDTGPPRTCVRSNEKN
jgi:LacI family transcriptional regulator